MRGDEIDHPPEEHPSLSRSWTSWKEQRSIHVKDGRSLLIVRIELEVAPKRVQKLGRSGRACQIHACNSNSSKPQETSWVSLQLAELALTVSKLVPFLQAKNSTFQALFTLFYQNCIKCGSLIRRANRTQLNLGREPTARYTVPSPRLNCSEIARHDKPWARSSTILMESIAFRGRPIRLPLAFAFRRPAFTRSWISARSNSAIAPDNLKH